MGVVITERSACGRVNCLRERSHMRSEEKSRDIFLNGRQRERDRNGAVNGTYNYTRYTHVRRDASRSKLINR